jgi:hypothetical protein
MQSAPAGPDLESSLGHAVNDVVTRTIVIAGLVGIAMVHVLQMPDAWNATGYLGALFVVVVVVSLVLSATLTRTSDDRAWAAAGVFALLIMIGYVLSRTSGLPGWDDDIGEWSEPLGLASLVVEGLVLCVTTAVVAADWHAAVATASRPVGAWPRQATGPQPG